MDASYEFWLHMNHDYRYRWYCTDGDGTPIAVSGQSWFNRADAERALERARDGSRSH